MQSASRINFFSLFVVFCCLLLSPVLPAQNKKIDSLKKEMIVLESIKGDITADSNLIEIYYSIADEYYKLENRLKELIYTKKGLDLTAEIIDLPTVSMELKEQLFANQATGYGNVGLYYDDIGDYPKSLTFYFKALKIDERMGNKKGMLFQLVNISTTYGNLGDQTKSIEYNFRALAIAKELNSIVLENTIHGNIAAEYIAMKNYRMALKYFNIIRGRILDGKDTVEIINLFGNLGMLYKGLGDIKLHKGSNPKNIPDYDTAIVYYKKAFEINKIAGNKSIRATLLASLGSLFVNMKEYTQAKIMLLQSLTLSKELNDLRGVMEVNEHLSSLYSDLGDTKQSFEYYKDHIAARDSLFNIENAKKNVETEMNFEFEKKDAVQKAEHEKTVIALEAENKIQKNTRNFIVLLAVMSLLLVASGFVYFNSRKALQLRELYSQQLLLSQEQERQRISKELHDSIGQNILFIKNQMIKNNDLRLMPSVDATLEEVRSISKDLYPNQLEKYGLIAAVDALAEKVRESSNIFVSYDLDAIDKALSPDKQINYYRIIQECITNALKHADASALRISASQTNGTLELVVQDNGKGFDKEILSKKAQRSFGLLNLEERVKHLKGKLALETSPGNGTKYIFSIPS
jgi:signal transduction histidine kinase